MRLLFRFWCEALWLQLDGCAVFAVVVVVLMRALIFRISDFRFEMISRKGRSRESVSVYGIEAGAIARCPIGIVSNKHVLFFLLVSALNM